MSDSESDDALLHRPVFGNVRKTRAKDKEKKQRSDTISRLLKSSGRQVDMIARCQSTPPKSADLALLATPDSKQGKGYSVKRNRDPLREGFFEAPSDDEIGDTPGTKKRRGNMVEDIRDEASSCLGVRQTISFDPTRTKGTIKFFASKQEALQDLDTRLEKIGKGSCGSGEDVEGSQGTHVKLLRRAIVADLLEDFLMKAPEENQCETLYFELCSWLLSVVQSAGLEPFGLFQLVASSLNLIRVLIKTGKVPAGTCLSSLECFLFTLECWVDLGKCSRDSKTSAADSKNEHQTLDSKNLRGLVNFLSICRESLPLLSDQVELETWSKCLVCLTRVGIDIAGTSTDKAVELVAVAQSAFIALVDVAVTKLNDPAAFSAWADTAASDICRGLYQLGPGRPGADDADDESGWTCYAAAVRNIVHVGSNSTISYPACELKASVALKALDVIHGSALIDEKTQTLLKNQQGESLLEYSKQSLGLRALLSTYISFEKLKLDEDSYFARFFAAAECSFVAFETGLLLLGRPTTGGENCAREFGCRDHAKHIYTVFSLLEKRIDRLSTISNRMTGSSHMRRFNYLLVLYNLYRRNSSNMLKKFVPSERDIVQKDLTGFFTRKTTPE